MSEAKKYLLLVINPGSTSTKIGVFENEICKCDKTLRHSTTELEKYDKIWDQYEFRKREIIVFLQNAGYDLAQFHAVVGRGGLLRPIESGTYRVDQHMINDLRIGVQGQHASNLGGVLAYGIGWDYSIPSFIVDPPAVDELDPLARLSGVADIPRSSLFHALNIRAVARKAAKDMGKRLDELNLIVAHLGGGITVAALRQGRAIEVNNGLSEGPFTPERSGSVPLLPLIDLCFSGKYDKKQIVKKLVGGGGLVSYLGTNSAGDVDAMVKAGNPRARQVYEAMAYQISCEIGSRAVALSGKVDAIVLTGGMAHNVQLTGWIEDRVSFLGKVVKYPGEDELGALAEGGLRVLRGEEPAKVYNAQKKVLGIYHSETLLEYDHAIEQIESRLREAGFRFRQQDENIEILIRNGNGQAARMQEALDEFAGRKADLIIAIGSPAAQALKERQKNLDIPVVCIGCFDPVAMGLAQSYTGSGNNITGNCYRVTVPEQIANALEPLVGKLTRLGAVYKSGELTSEIALDEARKLSAQQGFELVTFDARTPSDLAAAAALFKQHQVQAVFLSSDSVIAASDETALKPVVSAFPTVCALESTIRRGGLVGRVADWNELCRRGAQIGIEILEGAQPSSIPIGRTPAARTIINLATARQLGLNVPAGFLDSAVSISSERKG